MFLCLVSLDWKMGDSWLLPPPRAAGQIQPRPWDVAEPLARGPPTRAAL